MKKFVTLVGSIVLSAASLTYAADATVTPAAGYKVAVVNVSQVLQQSPKVAELSMKLQEQFKPRQTKLDAAQKSLQDDQEQFKKDVATMSDKDREALQKKMTATRAALVKDVVAFQQDLNKEQGKVMQSVLSQLNNIIATIAKKNDYSLVLDAQAVVYAIDATDITKQVSKTFNKE